MLPQAKTCLCDAEWLNCLSPTRIDLGEAKPPRTRPWIEFAAGNSSLITRHSSLTEEDFNDSQRASTCSIRPDRSARHAAVCRLRAAGRYARDVCLQRARGFGIGDA